MEAGYHNNKTRKAISSRHQDIIYRAACGKGPAEIGREFGMHSSNVSAILNSPLAKAELRRIKLRIEDEFVQEEAKRLLESDGKDPVQHVIDSSCMEAVTVDKELMRFSQHDSVRQKSAWDLLNRGGYAPPDKQQRQTTIMISGESIHILNETLEQLDGATNTRQVKQDSGEGKDKPILLGTGDSAVPVHAAPLPQVHVPVCREGGSA